MIENSQIITILINRVRKRLFFYRILKEFVVFLAVGLFLYLSTLVSLGPSGLNRGVFSSYLFIFIVAALGLMFIYRLRYVPSKMDAASKIDSKAGLKDQVLSTHWFIGKPYNSPFIPMLIEKTAQLCKTIDPGRLLSISWILPFCLVVILFFSFYIAGIQQSFFKGGWRLDIFNGARAKVSLRAASDPKSPHLSPDVFGENLEDLDLADSPLFKKQYDTDDLVGIQDEINMRAILARDGIEKIAKALEGRPEYREVVDALRSERLHDAMTMLSQVAGGGPQISDTLKKNEGEYNSPSSESQFLESIDKAASELGNLGAEINEEALAQALQSIEDAQSMIDSQDQLRQLNDNVGGLGAPPDQLSPLTAARFGDQANPTEAQPSAEPISVNAQGGTLFRQGAVARGESDQDSDQGHQAGSASGDSEAAALEGSAVPRMEASLQLETVRINESKSDGRDDGEQTWFYSPTEKQAEDDMNFRDLMGRTSYSDSGAIDQPETPIRQKKIIRDYFINIHNKGEI